jgi:HNH endonuclease
MSQKIPEALAQRVRQRANHRCEYCHASEWLTGQLFHIDHIMPRTRGGVTAIDNLCLACPACNGSKLDRIDGEEAGERIRLFHPRTQRWSDHFQWSTDGAQVEGITPCGRITVKLLKLNRPLAIMVRMEWVNIHRHPPTEDR